MTTEKLVKIADIKTAETFKSLLDGSNELCVENKYFGHFSRRKDKIFAPIPGKFARYYSAPRIFYRRDDGFFITHEDFINCGLYQYQGIDREQQKIRIYFRDEDENLLKLAHLEFQIATILQILMISECLKIDLRNLKGDNESDLRWFLEQVIENLDRKEKKRIEKILLKDEYVRRIIHCFVHYRTPEGHRFGMVDPILDEHGWPSDDNMLHRLIFQALEEPSSPSYPGDNLYREIFSSDGLAKPSIYFGGDGTLFANFEVVYDLGNSKLDWTKTLILQLNEDGKRLSEDYVRLTPGNFPEGEQSTIFFLKLDLQIRFKTGTQGPYVRTRIAKMINRKSPPLPCPELEKFPYVGGED
jgi:hypothetical protein